MNEETDAINFKDKVIVVLAAGCTEGRELSRMVANAGARVVVVDREESVGNNIARFSPDRIEALRLDSLNPAHCQLFNDTWGREPLDLLIQCQPLRAPERLGASVKAIPVIARGLANGLKKGRGRVVVLFRNTLSKEDAGQMALVRALEALPELMQAESWAAEIRVTGLMLPKEGAALKGLHSMLRTLMEHETPIAPGVVIPLASN